MEALIVPGLLSTLLACAVAGYGIRESRRHERLLRRIPIRVHVNGTRGKSSVTRLIAGGLRAGGRRVLAKTTGTMARMILPDGSEVNVYRFGHPNIIEQTRVVRRAVEEEVEALVIECMAVTPELQPLSELRLIRSGVGAITNVRADHLDVMGPTLDDVAMALAQTAPRNGHLFTTERARAYLLERIARERGSETHRVPASNADFEDLAGFSYIEHSENVALALAVCSHLGVDRATALSGMQIATPDPGVLRRHTVRSGDKQVTFVNAFAANDPDSTALIWERLGLNTRRAGERIIVLLTCRADRLHRSHQLVALAAQRFGADHIALAGEATAAVAMRAVSLGIPRDRVSDLGGLGAERVYERILDLAEERAVVVGIGNIVGLGAEIALHFSNRAVSRG